jgi:hypothetical protein
VVDALRNQSCFAKNCQEHCKIQGCSPDPMATDEASCLFQITPKEDDREDEQNLVQLLVNERGLS